LEAIDTIVKTLFNAFRKLVEQFRNKAVVTNPVIASWRNLRRGSTTAVNRALDGVS